MQFDIVIIDSYFDLKSFEKPIKTYLTQQYYYDLNVDYRQEVELYVKESKIDSLDDYTIIEGPKEGRFYSIVDQRSSRYESSSRIYGAFYFYLHPESQVYNRAVFTILDVLSQIGGIFGILQPVWAVIVGIYAERMLHFSIFSRCYTLDNQENEIQEKNSSEENWEVELDEGFRNITIKENNEEEEKDVEGVKEINSNKRNKIDEAIAHKLGKLINKFLKNLKLMINLIFLVLNSLFLESKILQRK